MSGGFIDFLSAHPGIAAGIGSAIGAALVAAWRQRKLNREAAEREARDREPLGEGELVSLGHYLERGLGRYPRSYQQLHVMQLLKRYRLSGQTVFGDLSQVEAAEVERFQADLKRPFKRFRPTKVVSVTDITEALPDGRPTDPGRPELPGSEGS